MRIEQTVAASGTVPVSRKLKVVVSGIVGRGYLDVWVLELLHVVDPGLDVSIARRTGLVGRDAKLDAIPGVVSKHHWRADVLKEDGEVAFLPINRPHSSYGAKGVISSIGRVRGLHDAMLQRDWRRHKV